ncbi:pseudouridine synthase [Hippea maritima]|uniref:Pseudouridine synthase n=1 Tax=Hippea maritima (strain ATCC 700847 / DSM 10411 / MH2) TaxID=760142 RepID=F2LXX0_HIPMA|nr:pseudouridine synthase [Hippea maritima]AEA33235.1 pseudouridine synthase Rsu [Hippea maritima DSM 10411]
MRINKYIATALKISRREADNYVKEGRVKVNGKSITSFVEVDGSDKVEVDGELLSLNKKKSYFAFYKPPFVISSTKDNEGRTTVCDFFKNIEEKLICVGRLDYLSEGLLIITSDGEFANLLMHPRFKIRKTYLVKTKGPIKTETLKAMSKGVNLEDGFFRPIRIKKTNSPNWVLISIDTGRNRIIRRFLKKFDIKIDKLKRIAIGNIELGNLRNGEFRELTKQEIETIKRTTSNQDVKNGR